MARNDTKSKMMTAILDAQRAVEAAEDAIDAALAAGATEADEERLTAVARNRRAEFTAACQTAHRAFPPPAVSTRKWR
jgi:hypothetical protein